MLLSKRGFERLFCRAEPSSVEKRHWKSKGKPLDARRVVLLGWRSWGGHSGEGLALVASGPLSHLWEAANLHCWRAFFQKRASFPAKSTSFCKQHPCRHTAPSCFCTSNSPISHSRKDTTSTYKLQIIWRKKSTWGTQIILKSFHLFLLQLKMGVPKERDLWSAVTSKALCNCAGFAAQQCRRGTTLKHIKAHKGLT